MEEESELRFLKSEEILQELSDSIRKAKIRIMVIPEEGKREKAAESVFKEIIAESFPNLGKELNIQVHDTIRKPFISMQKNFSKILY